MKDNIKNHPFDEAIALAGGPDVYHGHTSKLYTNMVGPFGGVIAATLLNAAMLHPERQGEPLSLTVNFVAPIEEGSFEISAEPVRTNRSTQHFIIRLSQNGLAAATATAIFAIRRETWRSTEAEFPSVLSAKEVEPLSWDNLPVWIRNYRINVIKGGILALCPESSKEPEKSETIEWIRDEPGRPIDFLSLTAICDVFFPRIFVRRRQFTPIGTVSISICFHADRAALDALGKKEVLGHARAMKYHNNYFDQTAEVWSPSGELLATTSQVVYFKE